MEWQFVRNKRHCPNDTTGVPTCFDTKSLLRDILYVQSNQQTFTFSLHVLKEVSQWMAETFDSANISRQGYFTPHKKLEIISIFHAVSLLFSKAHQFIRYSENAPPEYGIVNNIHIPVYRFYCDVASSCCYILLQMIKMYGNIEKLSVEIFYNWSSRNKKSFKTESFPTLKCSSSRSIYTEEPPQVLDFKSFCSDFNEFLDSQSDIKRRRMNDLPNTASSHSKDLTVDLSVFWNVVLDTTKDVSKALTFFWDIVKGRWACRLGICESKISAFRFGLQQKMTILHLFSSICSLQSFVNHIIEEMYNIYNTLSDDKSCRQKFRNETASCVNSYCLDILDASMRSFASETCLFHCNKFFRSPLGARSLNQIYVGLLYFFRMKSIETPLLNRGSLFFVEALNFTLFPLWKLQHLALHPRTLSKGCLATLVNGLLVFIELQNFLIFTPDFLHQSNYKKWETLENNVYDTLWKPVSKVSLWRQLNFTFPQTLGISHIILCLNFIGLCTQCMFSEFPLKTRSTELSSSATFSEELKPSDEQSQNVGLNDGSCASIHKATECGDPTCSIDEGVAMALYGVFFYIAHLLPKATPSVHLRNELYALKLRLLQEVRLFPHQMKEMYQEITLLSSWCV